MDASRMASFQLMDILRKVSTLATFYKMYVNDEEDKEIESG